MEIGLVKDTKKSWDNGDSLLIRLWTFKPLIDPSDI